MTDVSNDTVLATGSGVARTLAMRTADMVNPLDFGAVGLGSTYTLAANTSFTWQGTTYNTTGWTLAQWQTIYPSATSTSDTFDTVAFEAAAAYANVQHKGLFVPTGNFYFNRPPNLGTPSVYSNPTYNVSGAQARVGGYLGPFLNFNGSGIPTIYLENPIYFTNTPTTKEYQALLYLTKDASLSTAASGNTFGLKVETNVGPNCAATEYGIFSAVNSSSTQSQQQNIGIWGQGTRSSGNGLIWGAIFGADDATGSASSVNGGLVVVELDVTCNGADDGADHATWGGTGGRKAAHFGIGPSVYSDFTASILGTVMTVSAVASGTITAGMYFEGFSSQEIVPGTIVGTQISGTPGGAGQYNISISNGTVGSIRMVGITEPIGVSSGMWGSTGALSYFGQAYGVATKTQAYTVFDARGAIPPAVVGSTNAVMGLAMTGGQVIEFAGNLGTASLAQSAQRALGYNETVAALQYENAAGTVLFAVDDAGDLTSSGKLAANGGVVGRTNGTAPPAGTIGEQQSVFVPLGSPVSITSASYENVTSLSLTAGSWLVMGVITIAPSATTVVSGIQAAVTSGGPGSIPQVPGSYYLFNNAYPAGSAITANVPQIAVNEGSAFTVYLNVKVEFSTSTCFACGSILAIRIG